MENKREQISFNIENVVAPFIYQIAIEMLFDGEVPEKLHTFKTGPGPQHDYLEYAEVIDQVGGRFITQINGKERTLLVSENLKKDDGTEAVRQRFQLSADGDTTTTFVWHSLSDSLENNVADTLKFLTLLKNYQELDSISEQHKKGLEHTIKNAERVALGLCEDVVRKSKKFTNLILQLDIDSNQSLVLNKVKDISIKYSEKTGEIMRIGQIFANAILAGQKSDATLFYLQDSELLRRLEVFEKTI